jgi:DNA helicase-2/ATP-dependent DNA helicase PcrA
MKFKKFVTAAEEYEALKKERNYLDFSDLNVLVLQLFNMFGSEKYVEAFKYVFIDEFQDTNKLQFQLIEFIAKHKNITVVGDPNQSIYGFRGSYKDSFNHFKKSFGVDDEKDIFRLDKSYRNPNNVLRVAHELIRNNYAENEQPFMIENANGFDGKKVRVVETLNYEEEARFVADYVEKAIEEGVPKKEICVLFRTHSQSEILREALEMKGIPIIASGRTSLLHKREIKTVISYLSILSNLYERSGTGDQAWWNLFHYKNTLSPSDSVKIGRYIKAHRNEDKAIDEVLLSSIDDLSLSNEGRRIVERVVNRLKELVKVANKPLPELILDVFEISGLNRAFTTERSVENLEALMNLRRFHELAENFYRIHDKTLPKFIEYLEIIDEMGVNIPTSRVEHIDAVRFMTIHASKGLEFERVIVTNLADKKFPVTRTSNEPLIPVHLRPHLKKELDKWLSEGLTKKQIEKKIKEYDKEIQLSEERRLAYVAFTRASKELILTRAKTYNEEKDSADPSIFLREINYKENENVEFVNDDSEDSVFFSPTSKFEKHKTELKKQLMESLDTEELPSIVERAIYYLACRDEKVIDFKTLLAKVQVNQTELQKHLERLEKESSLLKFDDKIILSPSSMNDYEECPKRFELKHLLQMPEQGSFDEELKGSSMGSFVHKVLENGVKKNYTSKEEFISEATKLKEQQEWETIPLEKVEPLIEVFWERNKGKYSKESICEMKLPFEMEGFKFYGIADRIDKLEDGSVEIIDYKTNKNPVDKAKRELQLGFYALALQSKGYKVKYLTLDMLKLEKPIIYELGEDGWARDTLGQSHPFKLEDVKKRILETAKAIKRDFETEFKVVDDENKCRYCRLKFYCPKWVV